MGQAEWVMYSVCCGMCGRVGGKGSGGPVCKRWRSRALRPPRNRLGLVWCLVLPTGSLLDELDPQGVAPKLGENHIKLAPNTRWVYLAPGAYVKGAIEYTTKSNFYATGHGVLSGEHYVYQANPSTYYQGVKSDNTSLRMWGHKSLGGGQTWFCQGPTITAPPFNTMDFYGSIRYHHAHLRLQPSGRLLLSN